MWLSSRFAAGLLWLQVFASAATCNPYNLTKFQVDLSRDVPRMKSLVRDTHLPDRPVYPGLGSSKGIDLDVLKSLRKEWISGFDWEKEQKNMNR